MSKGPSPVERSDANAGAAPWFMVEHDGTQPDILPEEQQVVSRKFTALMSDLMLGNPDAVATPFPYSYLCLRRRVSPHEYWSIALRQVDVSTGIDEVAAITMQRVQDGHGRDQVAYYQDREGVIRRRYVSEQTETVAKEHGVDLGPVREGASPLELDLGFLALLKAATEQKQNGRLEQSMGVNKQPVGIAEIDALGDFITHPDVKPPQSW